ncbi:diguanylate cyclase [Fontimonas thermophila]|uniref:diguanylate cyclase n=1 Tax=Fontimonas thermophila TaxID=1076937 RepID=A0A1I2JV20_9GAMM|nr:sensor domain-containing diguanylate cyclase [Fontimonas thermophila]SFF56676.1 diguanylate cyclase [Fontimonas thermophila]
MDNVLRQFAESVSTASNLEALTRPLLELLETITGMESTYLTTIDTQAGVQHILYARNTRRMQIPEGLSVPWHDTLCKRALEEGRPYTDDVGACWGDSQAARVLGIRTYLSQPVRTGDQQVFGTLCAASETPIPLKPETTRWLALFAHLIGLQVDRERLLEKLRRTNAELASLSLTDPLTGLANRRALIQALTRALASAEREARGLDVIFIDLDGFKAINDRHGHEIGDCFLAEVAQRLQRGLRAGDFIARYGGDEFVVVAMATGEPEELRQRIESLIAGTYSCHDVRFEYAGASVGGVRATPGERDPHALLARADAAMYAIKQQRRRERAAGPPPAVMRPA